MFDNHLECVVCVHRGLETKQITVGRVTHLDADRKRSSGRRGDVGFVGRVSVLSKHGRAITAIIPIRNTRGIDDVQSVYKRMCDVRAI